MRSMSRLACFLAIVVFGGIPRLTAQDATSSTVSSSDRQEARERILQTARRYADLGWVATPEHVLHGEDPDGIPVDTPDAGFDPDGFHIDGRENQGMPYKWGGFSSIEQFEQGIREGRLAGHIPSSGAALPTSYAVGVDCSGFVSRCWDLPQKHSTRSIGGICYELESFQDLLPGDIINSFDGHVVLFDCFADDARTQLVVYEAARTRVKASTYDAKLLEDNNYKALRYKPLDAKWTPIQLADSSWKRSLSEQGRFEPDAGAAGSLDDFGNPWEVAKTGEWIRYGIEGDGRSLRAVSQHDGAVARMHLYLELNGKVQKNEVSRSCDADVLRTLVDFAGLDQRFGALQLESSKVTPGRYTVGGETFDAARIEATILSTLLSRGTHYPVTFEITAVHSEDVPLEGFLEAEYQVLIEWAEDTYSRWPLEYRALEFYRD